MKKDNNENKTIVINIDELDDFLARQDEYKSCDKVFDLTDDSLFIKDNFDKIYEFIQNDDNNITIRNINFDEYKILNKIYNFKKNIIPEIRDIKSIDINELIENYNPNFNYLIDFSDGNSINYNKISKVKPENRVRLQDFNKKLAYYDNSILDDETFLEYVDYIAEQINNYAENDLDKVILLDKFLRDNIEYDKEYFNNREDIEALRQERGLGIHPTHMVQTLITNQKCVCSAFVPFVSLVLSHPSINIENDCCIDFDVKPQHIWNDIKLDGKWYMYDPTFSVLYDKEKNEYDYTLNQIQSVKGANVPNEYDLENAQEYDRKTIQDAYKKFKDIHMKCHL